MPFTQSLKCLFDFFFFRNSGFPSVSLDFFYQISSRVSLHMNLVRPWQVSDWWCHRLDLKIHVWTLLMLGSWSRSMFEWVHIQMSSYLSHMHKRLYCYVKYVAITILLINWNRSALAVSGFSRRMPSMGGPGLLDFFIRMPSMGGPGLLDFFIS